MPTISNTNSEWIYDGYIEDDDDSRWMVHTAIKGETFINVPHSPYERMTKEAFEFHVKNNFQRTESGFNWRLEDINEAITINKAIRGKQ